MKIIAPNKTTYKIPFGDDGNMQRWDSYNNRTERDNFFFEDTLKVEGVYRGRSAAGFHVVSQTNGTQYEVRASEMLNIIKELLIEKGVFTGTFTFRKGGANLSLGLINEKEIKQLEKLNKVALIVRGRLSDVEA
jgi:hypothetical protein